MAAIQVKYFDQIVSDMIAWVVANCSFITDFSPGSVNRSIIEALATELEQVWLTARVGFDTGLASVPQAALGFQPILGSLATGTVVFSCTAAAPSAITIPVGTVVATSTGVRFQTTAVGSIPQGQTVSGSIPVSSLVIGSVNNVVSGAISSIQTPLAGVTGVNNTAATAGGTDNESSAAYLTRFATYINGLSKSNPSGIISTALQVIASDLSQARSIGIAENFPPIAPFYENLSVYVDVGSGTASAALLTAIASALNGNLTATGTGVRAGGVKLVVYAANVIAQNIAIQVKSASSTTDSAVISAVTVAITSYVNALLIGQPLSINALIEAVMQVTSVVDIANLQLGSSVYISNYQSGASLPMNLTVGQTQVNRLGSLTVTVTH